MIFEHINRKVKKYFMIAKILKNKKLYKEALECLEICIIAIPNLYGDYTKGEI